VFTRTGTTWTRQQKLLASDGAILDYFGCSVSISGDTALIGVSGDDDNGKDSGSAYVFIKGGENQSNEPSLADFTWVPSNPEQNQTITFNASASNNIDGFILLYEWDWNNHGKYEESYTAPTTTHSWIQAGNYSVPLQITDNNYVTCTKTITIPVRISSGNNNTNGNDNTNTKGTPGFEMLLLVLSMILILVFNQWRRKSGGKL
jgi:hypothetical protein